jgi:RecG-like helicase
VGVFSRIFGRLTESDETRHAEEIRAWAETIPGSVRIKDAPVRVPTKLAGVVKRITVFPVEGQESLEAIVSDGTGDATVVFMGRRGIRGLTLGRRLVVEGMLGMQDGKPRMVNPRFEFKE